MPSTAYFPILASNLFIIPNAGKPSSALIFTKSPVKKTISGSCSLQSSTIISKSIGKKGGNVDYRGLVKIAKDAINSRAKVECDTLLIDDLSNSDTIPTNMVMNNSSILEHEASVSKISDDELFYLMSRGLDKDRAAQMIVMGFIEPFAKELPMEYAVELNNLIKLEMEGSIG